MFIIFFFTSAPRYLLLSLCLLKVQFATGKAEYWAFSEANNSLRRRKRSYTFVSKIISTRGPTICPNFQSEHLRRFLRTPLVLVEDLRTRKDTPSVVSNLRANI